MYKRANQGDRQAADLLIEAWFNGLDQIENVKKELKRRRISEEMLETICIRLLRSGKYPKEGIGWLYLGITQDTIDTKQIEAVTKFSQLWLEKLPEMKKKLLLNERFKRIERLAQEVRVERVVSTISTGIVALLASPFLICL